MHATLAWESPSNRIDNPEMLQEFIHRCFLVGLLLQFAPSLLFADARRLDSAAEQSLWIARPDLEIWDGVEQTPDWLPEQGWLQAADLDCDSEADFIEMPERSFKPTRSDHSAATVELIPSVQRRHLASSVANQSPSKFEFKEDSHSESLSRELPLPMSFADPIDLNVAPIVKWTIVVLLLASCAVIGFRYQQGPTRHRQPATELQLVESITIDQRSKLHLVSLENQRYLLATDLTGVKSLILVPNWHLDGAESDSL